MLTDDYFNTVALKIAEVSFTADKKLQSEEYRLYMEPDEVTPQSIVNDLVGSLVLDLDEIGVNLHCTLQDVVPNYYRLEQYLKVFAYFLPNTLYQKLGTDNTLRDTIVSMLNGDLTDGHETLGETYIRLIGLEDDALNPELHDPCEHLRDIVKTTQIFSIYLENMLSTIKPSSQDLDPEHVTAYAVAVQAYHDRMMEKLEFLDRENSKDNNALYGNVSFTELSTLLDIEVQRRVAIDTLSTYVWLWLTSKMSDEEKTPGLQAMFRNEVLQWREDCPTHIQYWVKRNQIPDIKYFILILCQMHVSSPDTLPKVVDYLPTLFMNKDPNLQIPFGVGQMVRKITDTLMSTHVSVGS